MGLSLSRTVFIGRADSKRRLSGALTMSSAAQEKLDAFLAQLPIEPFQKLSRESPIAAAAEKIRKLSFENLLGRVRDEKAADALKSAFFIRADAFDDAHQLAQEIPTDLGNWCHAVLHRREPDTWNSSYWYRRVHPREGVFEKIAREALQAVLQPPPALKNLFQKMRSSGRFQPLDFVECCDAALARGESSEEVSTLLKLQNIEWRALVEEAAQRAKG